jgi:hypothetical protein
MSVRFNEYLRSHFSGCRLLAEGHDMCRNRHVQVFLIPGYFDDVGFTDGTDSFIVPLAAESCTGSGGLLRGVNLRELVGRIKNGEVVAVARGAELSSAQASSRRKVSDDAPAQRRRVATPESQSQPQAPRRRHVAA